MQESPSTRSASFNPQPSSAGFSPWPLVCLLLVLYWTMAVLSKENNCNTFDELAHLVNGTSFWRTHDFRLAPESILIQRWATLPVAFGNYRFPATDQPDWHASKNWNLGRQFLYLLDNDFTGMLRRGRMMIALLGVALGLAVFLWSRHFFGNVGGLVSLFAFTFCPTMLTHGALVTSDMGAALFFLLSLAGLWTVLHRITPWTVLASSLALAALFVSKMSAVLIVPVGMLLLLLRLLSREPMRFEAGKKVVLVQQRGIQGLLCAGLIVVHVLVAWVLIWTMFEFRFAAFRESTGQDVLYFGPWEKVLKKTGWQGSTVSWALDRQLLPEAYLYSFINTIRSSGSRRAFFNGEVGLFGWRAFFPYCFLVKTPLAIFLLLGLGAWARRADPASRLALAKTLYRFAPLWIFFVVYWGFSIGSRLNIGQRHLLPIYPIVFIWAGAAGWWLQQRSGANGRTRGTVLTILALVWLAGETVYRWPYYLAYFNQVAGSPRHGYQHLVDSSLDWGQDLPGLKTWLQEHGVQKDRAYLSYFGTASIERHHLPVTILPGYYDQVAPALEPWREGVYCVSATLLQGVYQDPFGAWTGDHEATYQSLRQQVNALNLSDPQVRAKWEANEGTEYAQKYLRMVEHLRLSRLCHFLRQRAPDDHVGYSILIFRLTDEEIRPYGSLTHEP